MFPALLLFISFSISATFSHQISDLIRRNRNEANNSSSFSYFAYENNGTFSYEPLFNHAFPCPINTRRGVWEEASLRLLIPCTDGSIIDKLTIHEYLESYNNTTLDTTCQPIRGLERELSAIVVPMDITLLLEGDHTLTIFTSSFTSNNQDHPLVEFLYERNDEDCITQCSPSNVSIYSSASCFGAEMADNQIDMCDMSNEGANCAWISDTPQYTEFRAKSFLKDRKSLRLDATKKTIIYSSPYLAHTSFACEFVLDSFLNLNSRLELYLVTLDGNLSEVVSDQTANNKKKNALPLSLNRLLQPARIAVKCLEGSICELDRMTLKNCEGSSTDEICPPTSFTCSSAYSRKCLKTDRVCDLSKDCVNGEDEAHCEALPRHSMCDFSNASFCNDWTTTENLTGTSFESSSNGNFMTFRLTDMKAQTGKRVVFTSPELPPSSKRLMSPTSSLIGTCTLRFMYCTSAQWKWVDFRWYLSGGFRIWDLRQLQQNISNTNKECEWKRAVVPIPRMTTNYTIKFEIYASEGELTTKPFQLTNVSIAESCFINDTAATAPPSIYNLWPCNGTGPSPPSMDQCRTHYAETDEYAQIRLENRGWLSWISPAENQYKLELCGASGVSYQHQPGGHAGCVSGLIKLKYDERLEIMIGQLGDECESCASSAGGGATVIKKKDHWNSTILSILAVAGGGAGVGKDKQKAEIIDGGRLSSNVSLSVLRDRYDHWQIGDGFSHGFFPEFSIHCSGCEPMGVLSNRGGRCPDHHVITVQGGYGGGGPACDKSPGPGGGYIGGVRRESYSLGGSSYVDDAIENFHNYEGAHSGQGFVKIFSCSLSCPVNYTCFFESAEMHDHRMACTCIPGMICPEGGFTFLWLIVIGVSFMFVTSIVLYVKNFRRNCLRQKYEKQEMELSEEVMYSQRSENMDRIRTINIKHMTRNTIFIKKKLGKGNFGEVYLAEVNDENGQYDVAVKLLSLSLDTDTQLDFTLEALTLSRMKHPNIVSALGINTDCDPFYLIMEFMKGGDLNVFFQLYRDKQFDFEMDMSDFLKLCLDLVSACTYLEENHHVHRDIAARNVLLTTRAPGRVAKLADFGMVRDVYSTDYYRKEGPAKLPVKWLPLESVCHGLFTSKTDVWSFGILLWEIFSIGHVPYHGLNNQQALDAVKVGKRLQCPHGTPSKIWEMMDSTWREDPGKRPTFKHLKVLIEDFSIDETIKRLLPPPGSVDSELRDTDEICGRAFIFPQMSTTNSREGITDEKAPLV